MPIRVLLVEDSKISLVILRRILDSSPQIEVVGEAHTGLEALTLIPKIQPDVICTDLHMPQMDGLEFTSEVMTHYPRPILVLSVSVQQEDTHHVFEVLEAGAVEVCPKPLAGLTTDNEVFKRELIDKIIILSGVKVFKKTRKISSPAKTKNRFNVTTKFYPKPKIIVVGASTGGPIALQELFSQLPLDFPIPVICVQHICLGFLQALIDWLMTSCQLPIQIAQPGEMPKPGIIYFPPEHRHLEVDGKGRFVCSDSEPLDGHRPSVTVTFESVAQFYGKATVGILLTGMGRDGAQGMQAIAQAGGVTIAQDEATSVIFGMPKEAIDLGAAKEVLPISAIAPMLLELLQKQFLTL
ncbi:MULTISPECIES: chemotaxis-specific protein-glutamate methyltransferase CheB [unclassified Coleofasciculus]|uniref:chemotaxis-specific protein-glutamate methyltransferase CheB n=1 Tax=unclassified Coleofasciculus TaxID=2692782 RepID=UPI0018818F4C|nr:MULTISPECIES: chemotaxis-specific protein-glutamate methyltransferase CheB [unclassified Coleofasciculus]MBE9125619.1 chemotaxis-specific protein-glutamate methyltransferase CheB [Coleofasciculus sp. LEGE 07081]MBE9147333.1 chemotaxis-specific protein-glutamate methyltransferase CheB [Coleofasciculus sp. LEGE 07092]